MQVVCACVHEEDLAVDLDAVDVDAVDVDAGRDVGTSGEGVVCHALLI